MVLGKLKFWEKSEEEKQREQKKETLKALSEQ